MSSSSEGTFNKEMSESLHFWAGVLCICEDTPGIDIEDTMDHDFSKLVHSENALVPIISRPLLLSVWFDDTLPSQKRFVSLLNQIEGLLNQSLSVRAERWKGFDTAPAFEDRKTQYLCP